ncbi:pyridoxal 5'-phosphate synthase glutaminase subunit PdxT [Loigolactobacillus bifermentans]|jgi:5'-phosphate synthase pdxT subunit|uniref:Pyridoxal 5'-phosphate synthase subunit PdxT n=1 Tax=Loigolactobacillus bifermentans DSM 20003 TaxID=1423726 RepID=A0A0R1GLH0_9LACO|nr:pyridoxal 5'-phosphate synthase glutaminase subunit PdxT [Loigolactobacillus bifermentans]KRK34665.1 glutamine amidotransferase subunit PdxT [Loigolactobacillus bifermentans DSM 20003]QGG61069.1 pyridoxal 5'-phosphate synthase glutaminase subunit PdxT [Loigolactobacillus bifermentans]
MTQIGILALQGAFTEHARALQALGVTTTFVRTAADLTDLDGLVLPGGESTTMRKLLTRENLLAPLRQLIHQGLPTFGTCAGLVLLSQPDALNGLTGDVVRNGFGRQRESFETELTLQGLAQPFPAVFIRAPYLKTVGPDATVLAQIDHRIVAAQQANVLVTAFHPELTADTQLHAYFLKHFVTKS